MNRFRVHQSAQPGPWKGASAHRALTGVKVDDCLSMLSQPPRRGFAAPA
ncbi:MAG: hypothetical protein JXX28_11790 [Deltaproteobacteria bacterium]|nr:hypothetical protein [Deltaproteobacteria bacterium]